MRFQRARFLGRFGHKLGIDLANLVFSRVWFCALVLNWVCCFKKRLLFHHYREDHKQKPFKIMFRATVSVAKVINRVSNVWSGHKSGREKWQNLVINRVKAGGFGKRTAHPPTKLSWKYPPGLLDTLLLNTF